MIFNKKVDITDADKLVVCHDIIMEIGSTMTKIASSVAVEDVVTLKIELIETKKR